MKKTIIIFILMLLLSCVSETEIRTNTTNTLLENGKILKVSKTNKTTTRIGVITKTYYGTTHNFKYSFTVNKNDVRWKNRNCEPKQIIFTKDTVYVKSFEKKTFPYQQVLTDTIINRYKDSIVVKYEAYIDKRYFFKILGNDFWIDIPPNQYKKAKRKNTTFKIPNDNEYTIKDR